MEQEIQVGDMLQNTSPHALCRKIRVIEVTRDFFIADVLEGENIANPLKVLRAGWCLYKKTTNENN